ncbi:MAG TPA: hypothetical protein DCX06_03560 [Opitutae bacterium]|nr:hypothetical protein [Opitutae bacterium]
MNSSSEFQRGYLTLAFGDQRFLDLAANLALSLKYWDSDTPRAIVCDKSGERFLAQYFDYVIALKDDSKRGTYRKLDIYEYTPFAETMFIDADSLVLKNTNRLWEKLGDGDFGVFGSLESAGNWRFDVEQACRFFSVSHMPKINGGCYYFRQSNRAKALFDQAAQEYTHMAASLNALNVPATTDPTEEFLISIAMAKLGISPKNDKLERVMIGPIQLMDGHVRMNVLQGVFECWNDQIRYQPVVAHLFLGLYNGFHYRREVLRLKIHGSVNLPTWCINLLIHISHNMWYYIFTKMYSLYRSTRKQSIVYPMACIPWSHFFGNQRRRISGWITRLKPTSNG